MNKLIALALSGVAVAALPTAAEARGHHGHHDRYYSSSAYAYPRQSYVYRTRYVAPVVRVRSYGYPSYYGAGYYGGYGNYGYGYGYPGYGYGYSYGYPSYGYSPAYYGYGYSPAYYGGYGYNNAGGVVAGAVIGAVIAGALTSNHHHHHRYYRYRR